MTEQNEVSQIKPQGNCHQPEESGKSVVVPLQITVFTYNLQPTLPAISLIRSHFSSFLCL